MQKGTGKKRPEVGTGDPWKHQSKLRDDVRATGLVRESNFCTDLFPTELYPL